MLRRSISAFSLACTLAAPAFAAPDASEAAGAPEAATTGTGGESVDEADPETVIVTGSRIGYGTGSIRSGTRTDTPLQDVPQAISVISERQIEDQAMRSIGDVLRYVPGAMIGQGEGHRDQITLRGNSSTSDFFIDGLRDDIQYYRPLYNLERVEVLRGPNAMIFGRGGGGGIVNRVPKRPLADQLAAFSASSNSFGARSADVDLNQPLGSGAAVRLNALYEEFGNHRDAYEGRLIALNPTLGFDLSPATRLGLSYEFVDDERVVDRGIPSARQGTLDSPALPLAGFRDTFFGARGVNDMAFDAHILRGSIGHSFTDALSLTSRLLYARYDKAYRNAFAATPVRERGGTREVGIEAYEDAFQRDNLFSQTDLVWEVSTGAAEHTLLAGFEYGDQSTGNQRVNGFFGTSAKRAFVPLAERIAVPQITFRTGPGTSQRNVESDAEVLAFYLQDQVEIGQFELIGGIRHDRFRLGVSDLLSGARFSRTDRLWSPRLGFVFHPVDEVSVYASYSRSYLPQSGDQFVSLDATAQTLEPERFDNREIGVKWEPRDGLLLSAATYQLDRANTRALDPNDSRRTVQTGAQRSRGIEIEGSGSIRSNWNVSAGYTLQEAEIRRTTSAAPAGREVPLVPRHQAFLWTRYDLSRGFGLGIGATHQSRSFASISNAVVLPSYTRVDAGIFLRLVDGVQAQVNVENLLGESYFPTAHNDNNITTGAPRSVRGTIRFQF